MKSNLNQIFDVSGLNPAEAAASFGASAVIPSTADAAVDTPEIEVEMVVEPLSEEASSLPEFQPMSDDMTFGQAFAAARAAMGPGGSFSWHGQVYGTYYRNEWDTMTADQRHDFTAAAIEARESYYAPDEPLYAAVDETDFSGEDVAEVAVVGHEDSLNLSDDGSMVIIDLAEPADSVNFVDLCDTSEPSDIVDMSDVF